MEQRDLQAEQKRIGAMVVRLYDEGFSIIPLMHPWQGDGDGKKPVVDWKKYQTRRPSRDEVDRWFFGKHLHNVGVVCGPISNLVVVDIDSVEARREVIKADWPTPGKFVKTAKGEHWYYGWNEKYEVGNRSRLVVGDRQLALDVRGVGGYVVGPASRHATGVVYELVEDVAGSFADMAGLPDVLAERIKQPRRAEPNTVPVPVADNAEIEFRLAHVASAKTRILLRSGCPKGERNERVFRAARDMNGFGVPEEVAIQKLLKAPLELKEREIRRTVRSAYATPAYPAVLYSFMDDADVTSAVADINRPPVAAIMQDIPSEPSRQPSATSSPEVSRPDAHTPKAEERKTVVEEEGSPAPRPAGDPPLDSKDTTVLPTPNEMRAAAGRPPRISNFETFEREDDEGKVENVVCYRHMEAIRKDVIDGLGGWPKSASNVMFAVKHDRTGNSGWDGKRLARHEDVWWLAKDAALFGFLHAACDGVAWRGGMLRASRVDPSQVSAVGKSEFFDRLNNAPAERFDSIEILPNHPRLPRTFYLTPALTKIDQTCPRFREFCGMFNPASNIDGLLIQAALLTPMWGGSPGTRPAFIFSSEHGRGAGKTATAQAIAQVYGGAVEAGQQKQGPDAISKALVSPEGLTKRVVIWDNLKGRQDYSAIESMITAPTIQEHRLYTGHVSRPNHITWLLTANTTEASKDLAQRCVVINIGKQQHERDFVGDIRSFLDQHREELIAEIMFILQGNPTWSLPPSKSDRWQAWTKAVLCRIPGGDACLDTIKRRRVEIDADIEDSQAVLDMIVELAENLGCVEECKASGQFTFSTKDLWEVAEKYGYKHMTLLGFGRWVARKIKDGELPHMTKFDGRVFGKKVKGFTLEPGLGKMRKLMGDTDGASNLFDEAKHQFQEPAQ